MASWRAGSGQPTSQHRNQARNLLGISWNHIPIFLSCFHVSHLMNKILPTHRTSAHQCFSQVNVNVMVSSEANSFIVSCYSAWCCSVRSLVRLSHFGRNVTCVTLTRRKNKAVYRRWQRKTSSHAFSVQEKNSKSIHAFMLLGFVVFEKEWIPNKPLFDWFAAPRIQKGSLVQWFQAQPGQGWWGSWSKNC